VKTRIGSGGCLQDIANFMHLDLMPNNRMRVDDVAGTEFGEFPRGAPFIVQVTFVIGPAPTAHIVLSGAGAMGTADRAITAPASIFMARQFGSARLSVAFPHLGTLQATTIAVTRRTD
jgi:hypothetical protein